MPELSHIDPRSAALLVMDYQVDALTRFMTTAQSADAIACVPGLIATARDGNPCRCRIPARSSRGQFPQPPVQRAKGKRNAGGRERRRCDPSGRSGTRRRTDRGQAPRQPVRWH